MNHNQLWENIFSWIDKNLTLVKRDLIKDVSIFWNTFMHNTLNKLCTQNCINHKYRNHNMTNHNIDFTIKCNINYLFSQMYMPFTFFFRKSIFLSFYINIARRKWNIVFTSYTDKRQLSYQAENLKYGVSYRS